jgi:hypothetical protein
MEGEIQIPKRRSTRIAEKLAKKAATEATAHQLAQAQAPQVCSS